MIKNDNNVDDDKCGVDDGDNNIDWRELLVSMDVSDEEAAFNNLQTILTRLLSNLAINSRFPQLISGQFYRLLMKWNSANEQDSNPRKRAPSFKTDEVIFFLNQ